MTDISPGENNRTDNSGNVPKIEDLVLKIEKLEKSIGCLSRGGMLSSQDFWDLVVTNNQNEYLIAHSKGDWNKPVMFKNIEVSISDDIQEKITVKKACFLIRPFDPFKVTTFSYDLAIGDQYYSLCDIERRKHLLEDNYYIKPRETIIVLTEEEIALPPDYSATIWPRFNHVREGIFQSMVKIDPTWRGQIAVAITNLSPAEYPINRGDLFATLIIYELTRRSIITLKHPTYLDTLDPIKSDNISSEFLKIHNANEIIEKLNEHNLISFCELKEQSSEKEPIEKLYYLLFSNYKELTASKFNKLKIIFNEPYWKKMVDETIKNKILNIKSKQAFGLKDLDLIIEGRSKGKRLTAIEIEEEKNILKENLEKITIELEKTAKEFGGPCKFLPIIPEYTMREVENRIVPKIEAEVSANLFPKLVTLTLTVLGLLSLIAAIISLLLGKFPSSAPFFKGIDWPGSIAVIVTVIGFVCLFFLLMLLYGNTIIKNLSQIIAKWRDKEFKEFKNEITTIKKQIEELKNQKTQ